MKIAVGIVTAELHAFGVGELPVAFDLIAAAEFDRPHLCSTPWAVEHDERVLAAIGQKLLKLLRSVIVADRRYVSANPEAD